MASTPEEISQQQQQPSTTIPALRTSLKVHRLTYTWNIEDFHDFHKSLCAENPAALTSRTSDFNYSSLNSISLASPLIRDDHLEFYLRLHPSVYQPNRAQYYDRDEDQIIQHNIRFMSLFFCPVRSNVVGAVAYKYQIAILGKNGQKHNFREGLREFPKNPAHGSGDWGWEEFILCAKLLRYGGQVYLPENRLSIFCEVRYMTYANESHDDGGILGNPVENELVQRSQVSVDLAGLRHSDALTDVTFVLDSGRHEIRAHRAILGARSRVFHAMFASGITKEALESRVELVDIEVGVFGKVLDFIYSGLVGELDGLEDKVLAAADKYELEPLKIACEERLCARLSPESVSDLLVLADIHSAGRLKARALEYFHKNAQESIKSLFEENKTDRLVSALRTILLQNPSASTEDSSTSAMNTVD